MICRDGKLGEIDALARISKDSLTENFSAENFKSSFNNSQEIILVSESGGEITGYCVASFAADEAELLQIAVDFPYRGRGAARLLLAKLKTRLILEGVKSLFLEVRSKNTPAITLYESLGMERVGIRPGFYESPGDDAYIFRQDYNA